MNLRRVFPASLGAVALALATALPSTAGAATQGAPVIHEKFTVLACPSKPRTTVQLEGCAEHKVIAADRALNSLNAKVFAKLSRSGRTTFTTANAAWVSYRDAACTAQASIYSGGSLQPVIYASCLAAIDGSHATELRRILTSLSPAG